MTHEAFKSFDLNGKVALITGASKGIGAAMAQGLALAGAKVALCSRNEEAIREAAASIADTGLEAVGFAANVGDDNDLQLLVDNVLTTFGGIDILINNAAINPVYGPVADTDRDVFDKIMAVNLKGPFQLCKYVLPSMKSRGGGSIINVSSAGGLKPEPGLGIYSVSKAALNSLGKVLAQEWGAYGIRVNTISPGLIKTKFSKPLWQDEKTLNRLLRSLPLARIGEPNDLIGITLFLASDASAYCTGGLYPADGGIAL